MSCNVNGVKTNFSFIKIQIFFLTLLFSQNFLAQNSYLMSISNGEKVNPTTYEFDILFNSTDEDFELTSYQVVLSFDTTIVSGSILFSYIESTSDLSNTPSTGIGVNNVDGSVELTFASMPGSDIITSQVIRVGRFRVESTDQFDLDPIIDWDFSGNVFTILTGSLFTDITNSSNHYSDLTTSNESGETKPDSFELYQNYPNPFNPSTKIRFNLSKQGQVKLAIFNLLGEQVAELINGEMLVGIHEISFNAENLASGIYVYKLNIENQFSDIKKMILMK